MNEQLVTMKQYTTPDQTAKLIELGFEKPKGWNAENISSRFIMAVDVDGDNEFNYSIGELIEMLPEKIADKHDHDAILQMTCYNGAWRVKYAGIYDLGLMISEELIDALYYMVVNLKEEGVI